MRGMKIILSSVFTILASLIFGSQVVFAVDDITISLSPNGINMTQMPGNFTSESQTITISTTNPTGYKVNLSTTETTSALINVADSSITIPTITLPRGKTSIPAADITYGYGYSVDDGANYSPIPNPDSYKEIFRYLSKYKKVRTKEGGKWSTATMLKYIEELVTVLGV